MPAASAEPRGAPEGLESVTKSRAGRRFRVALSVYLGLLVVSNIVALVRDAPPRRSSADSVQQFQTITKEFDRYAVEFAYRELHPEPDGPVLVLLHGSPGSSADFDRFVQSEALANRRIIVPDLPGFGLSTSERNDYSVRAHAEILSIFLNRLGFDEWDIAGFSMGGGVALELAAESPKRVRSITMMSAIGVQELELFGDYQLNHLIHGAQLAALRVLPWLVPHFGTWTGEFIGVPYARNFYDTDQRPLRGILERYESPMLILHGERDFLVPVEVAREHARIVPQSELVVLDASHFYVFLDPERAATELGSFLERLDRGEAKTRASAEIERLAASREAFDPTRIPPFVGPSLLLILSLIAFATLISEDLTCIGAGLLVAQGRIDLFSAAAACFFGILVGDMLLYLAGRLFGRPALTHAPLSWFVKPEAVDRAAAWFQERGGRVVFVSRFVPGLRLPTYVAAGVLRQSFATFSFYFVLAGLLWTPLFVAIASWAGAEAQAFAETFESWALPVLIVVILVLLSIQRVVVPAFTYRGRRMLAGRWRRIRHWEFWPPFVFYIPVVGWILWLALRHRGLALITAANPGIPTGGFIGESKSEILNALRDQESRVARFCVIRADWSEPERARAAEEFQSEHGLALPLVLKPDVGQRGSGVKILRDAESLKRALAGLRVTSLLQEFALGLEYGLFYVRKPSESEGRIFSVTEKVMPIIVGDGVRSVEDLILRDRRAVAQLDVYLDANAQRLLEVPASGAELPLVELGTHCRGAVFLNGERLVTGELTQAVERVSSRFEGFYFGRYDVIAASPEALRAGEFKVIELNGLTSEATHIYDPKTSLLTAYRVLFEQWSLAFQIASECRARGTKPSSMWNIVRETLRYRRLARGHRPAKARVGEPASTQ